MHGEEIRTPSATGVWFCMNFSNAGIAAARVPAPVAASLSAASPACTSCGSSTAVDAWDATSSTCSFPEYGMASTIATTSFCTSSSAIWLVRATRTVVFLKREAIWETRNSSFIICFIRFHPFGKDPHLTLDLKYDPHKSEQHREGPRSFHCETWRPISEHEMIWSMKSNYASMSNQIKVKIHTCDTPSLHPRSDAAPDEAKRQCNSAKVFLYQKELAKWMPRRSNLLFKRKNTSRRGPRLFESQWKGTNEWLKEVKSVLRVFFSQLAGC